MNSWNTEETGSNTAIIIVGGSRQTVEAGVPFTAKVNEVARQHGLGKIRVILDGSELFSEGDAPTNIPAGCTIDIRRDDRAGLRR